MQVTDRESVVVEDNVISRKVIQENRDEVENLQDVIDVTNIVKAKAQAKIDRGDFESKKSIIKGLMVDLNHAYKKLEAIRGDVTTYVTRSNEYNTQVEGVNERIELLAEELRAKLSEKGSLAFLGRSLNSELNVLAEKFTDLAKDHINADYFSGGAIQAAKNSVSGKQNAKVEATKKLFTELSDKLFQKLLVLTEENKVPVDRIKNADKAISEAKVAKAAKTKEISQGERTLYRFAKAEVLKGSLLLRLVVFLVNKVFKFKKLQDRVEKAIDARTSKFLTKHEADFSVERTKVVKGTYFHSRLGPSDDGFVFIDRDDVQDVSDANNESKKDKAEKKQPIVTGDAVEDNEVTQETSERTMRV